MRQPLRALQSGTLADMRKAKAKAGAKKTKDDTMSRGDKKKFEEEAFPLSQMATGLVFEEGMHTKSVLDNVHGTIYLDTVSLKFIDTEQFQRLRDIKQLGACNLVYPGAVHSRFEHSLGVYSLAGKAIQRIQHFQGKDLDLEQYDVKAVKLAGLLHDVGHGPFSHVFDGEFIPAVMPGIKWHHEHMSARMIDYIVDEHHIDIDREQIKYVQDLILGSRTSKLVDNKKTFLYDIVANGRNSIDVDKFDYIERDSRACGVKTCLQYERLMENMRVIDDEICYRSKEYWNVHKLFEARADLFRRVYTHPKVKALQLMVVDALVLANDYLKLSSYIEDPAEYWKLDDSVLKAIENTSEGELTKAKELLLRLKRRDLYRFCNEYIVPYEHLEHFKDVTPEDILCAATSTGAGLKRDDIAVSNVKIDLSKGLDNPLNSVHFFEDYDSNEKFKISKDRISHLFPSRCQDRIVRVYAKDPLKVDAISMAFENFQEKTYGIKQQVHGTPRRRLKCSSLNFY